MIDEKQIHIGGWYYREDWEFTGIFQWQANYWYWVGECLLFLENISPIELTEEWLIKFGFDFIKREEDYLYFRKTYINECFKASKQRSFNVFLKDIGNHEYVSGEIAIVNYVHQLQNLYFALTGEELTVNG